MSSPYCSICHSIYAETETVVITRCGHIYHNECISGWINTNATCPKCRETCHSTQRIHLDFVNDDNLACAQAKEALAAGSVDEETIKTLFDSIESLTLDKQIAEKNLLEMRQLIKKINWIPEIQSEVLELNSMNSTVLELKEHIDELSATRESFTTVLFHSHAKAKRGILIDKIESGIRQLIHLLHNKRTEYVDAMYSKQNALRRVQELERDIIVNQTELNEKRKNEMDNAKKRIEELRITVSTKQNEIESMKAQVQDVQNKHSNETRDLRERNRIEVESMRKELQDLKTIHTNETRELRDRNRSEIENMRKQFRSLKSSHCNEMRELREQSKIEMENLRQEIQDQKNTHTNDCDKKIVVDPAQGTNQVQNQTQTQKMQNQSQRTRNYFTQNRAPPRNNQSKQNINKSNPGPSNSNIENQAVTDAQICENQNQSQNQNPNPNCNRKNGNRRRNRKNNNQNANRPNSEINHNSMRNNNSNSNDVSHFDRPTTAPRRQFNNNNNRNFENNNNNNVSRGQPSRFFSRTEKCEQRRPMTWDDLFEHR